MFTAFNSRATIVSDFSKQTGIVDGKVDAILAGLDSPEYIRAQYTRSTTTTSSEPTNPMTMADIEGWFKKLWDKPYHTFNYGMDTGTGKDYSKTNFNFLSEADHRLKRLIDELFADFKGKREPVDPREWRELYEAEYGVADLLSGNKPIPHED